MIGTADTFGIDRIRIALTCQARVPRRKNAAVRSGTVPQKVRQNFNVKEEFFFFFFFLRALNTVLTEEKFLNGF